MCVKNGKTGYFVLCRKTVKKRMPAKLQAMKTEPRRADARIVSGAREMAPNRSYAVITNTMQYRATRPVWDYSGSGYYGTGGMCFVFAARFFRIFSQ